MAGEESLPAQEQLQGESNVRAAAGGSCGGLWGQLEFLQLHSGGIADKVTGNEKDIFILLLFLLLS